MEVIFPGDKNYNDTRLLWNRAINKYPSEIIYCNSINDVRIAIKYCVANELKIRIRGGGHNYRGFSSGDGVVVIDTSNINDISLNYEEDTFTIGSGAKLGEVYTVLGSQGIPFSGGACPTVCICGLASGGGWGYSIRKYGLTCDSLLEIKLVNYKGELIVANRYINSDLFWACRGAGGCNFGVIVSMKFKMERKVQFVTQFQFEIKDVSIQNQVEFFEVWQKFITTATKNINIKCEISHSLKTGITIIGKGLFYGTEKELNEVLYQIKKVRGFELTSKYVSFLQAILILGSVYPQYAYFYNYARFVKRYYEQCEIEKLVDVINKQLPAGSEEINLNLYGLGGEVAKIGKHDSAFYHRESLYIIALETVFKSRGYDEVNKTWIKCNSSYIESITEGSYINFPYTPLVYYMEEYYCSNRFRLEAVKKKYDPKDIFYFEQGIK